MTLDVQTLFYLTIYVDAVLGTLLLFVWSQNTAIKALSWWGAAHLMRAGSVVLYGYYGVLPDLISIDVSSAILLTSYGVTWNGARIFGGHRTLWGSLTAGAIAWAAACILWPEFNHNPHARAVLSAVIIATYAWLAAFEFWRGRTEGLVSRWPAIFILFAHGALFLLRSPLSALVNMPSDNHLLTSAWISVLSAESLLFPISISFILVAMAKERTELSHKNAAKLDPLTGLPNRRAFLQDAEQLRSMRIALGQSIAVLMIDLDHFKSINDRYGHSVGDRVLQTFAATARESLKSFDLIGRLGGEEFAVVLSNGDYDNAVAVAERIRADFAQSAAVVDGNAVGASLSIGIALIGRPADEVSLLGEADRALYRAKDRGRNRVEVNDTDRRLAAIVGKRSAA